MTFLFPLLIGYLVLVMASMPRPTELHTASPGYTLDKGVSGYNTNATDHEP